MPSRSLGQKRKGRKIIISWALRIPWIGQPVPFSFMSATREDETFEMVDMQDEKEKEKLRDSGSTAVGSTDSHKGKDVEDVKSPDTVYSQVTIGERLDQDVDRTQR